MRNEKGQFERSMLYGFGVDDVEGTKESVVNGKRIVEKSYSHWKNMIKRCYHKNGEYYGKVVVADKWRFFSNFKNWFDKNYIDGYELDKDICGGSVYSENTCLFIPRKLNVFITSINKPCGAYYDKARGKFQSYTKSLDGKRVNIGRFNTQKEAVSKAKLVKLSEINRYMVEEDISVKLRIKLQEMCDKVYFNFIM